jgi:hypothetical protein
LTPLPKKQFILNNSMSKFDKLTETYMNVANESFLPKGYKPQGIPLEKMNDKLLKAIINQFRGAGGDEVRAVKSGPNTIYVQVVDANIKLIHKKEVIVQQYQITIEPYKE